MAWSCERVSFEELKPARTDAEYALHVAALELNLAEPIVISNKDDIKSKANWRDGFDPYHHQVENLITFCRRLPVTLLADDVGLGKTISAGLILGELIERKRVSRALVVCPAILGHQWVEELSSKFGIEGDFVIGSELAQSLQSSSKPVVVTTYASARIHLGDIRPGQFDMLILDEAHKLRNLRGTDKPPLMAQRVRHALEARIFKFVLMLTATPIQNRVWDLYSLIDLLTVAKGHRNPLGNPGEFRVRFIDDAAGRRLRPSTAGEFRSILRQYIVRTRRDDAKLKFPERLVETRRLRGTDVEARMVEIVRAEIDDLGPLVQISLSQAMMSSPQALARQLANMSEKGTVSVEVVEKIRRIADKNPITAKLEGLLTLVRELRRERPDDWRLVVFTLRKETQDAIGRALIAEGVKVDFIRGGAAQANHTTVERFRAVPPQTSVIVSTDAGAEGVNLQSGNVVVNYDLPWNPMVMEQRIGRVQRLASTHEHVVVVNLVVADSVEERVVARLLEKLQAVAESIGDIETILESAGQDDDDSFEEMVRKLVLSSLKGQDVEESTRAATISIERAKVLMKQQRGTIDRVFGSTPPDALPEQGLPEIGRVKASLPAGEFVTEALSIEGAKIQPRSDGTIDVIRTGRATEWIALKPEQADQAADGNKFPELYLPGRAPFEALVQKWVERAEHCVRDISVDVDTLALKAAKKWCAAVAGAKFAACAVKETRRCIIGEVISRARAANGVDSMEKLLYIEIKTDGHPGIDLGELRKVPIQGEHIAPELVVEGVSGLVSSAVENDSDIAAFCKFYERRRYEELSRAGGDERRRAKVFNDLTPKVLAEVVGISGFCFDIVRASIAFDLDDRRQEVELELVPATGQVLLSQITEASAAR